MQRREHDAGVVDAEQRLSRAARGSPRPAHEPGRGASPALAALPRHRGTPGRVRPVPRPATTTRTSARPRTRASTGEMTSMAWMRESGTRIDCRRISPVVICRSPPWTRQRVTSQETMPATIASPRSDEAFPREARSPATPGVELGAEEDEHGHRAAGPHHGRERVQTGPLGLARRGPGGADVIRDLVACASPRDARRSRRLSASACASPGMRASLAAAAVCSCTVARPKARSIGPALTSMNCMRPYGTTLTCRKSSPWRTIRSSSRSRYPHERYRPRRTIQASATSTTMDSVTGSPAADPPSAHDGTTAARPMGTAISARDTCRAVHMRGDGRRN